MFDTKKILLIGIAALFFYEYVSFREKKRKSLILFLSQRWKSITTEQTSSFVLKSGPSAFSPDFGNENS